MRSPLLLALLLLAFPACGEAAPEVTAGRARADKADLYGDPGLVPSREGERARRELALTSDLEESLASMPEVEAVEVVVRSDGDGLRAVIGLDRASGASADEVEAAARLRVQLLAPEAAVVLASRPAPAPEHGPRGLSFALALALLGLGSSLGVLLERLRLRGLTRA